MPSTAIVIGGTRRVGRWVTDALLIEGHSVHALYRTDTQSAREAVTAAQAGGYTLSTHQVDATNTQALKAVIDGIAADEGGVSILVNSMGPSLANAITGTTPKDFRELWEANMFAVHNAVTATVPYLRLNGGRIINFLSAGADKPRAFKSIPLYAATKAMLASYSRSLARELIMQGITVNCISLGVTDLAPEGAPGFAEEDLPSGKFIGQEDVAAAVWHLTGPGSSQLTGTVLEVAGGFGL